MHLPSYLYKMSFYEHKERFGTSKNVFRKNMSFLSGEFEFYAYILFFCPTNVFKFKHKVKGKLFTIFFTPSRSHLHVARSVSLIQLAYRNSAHIVNHHGSTSWHRSGPREEEWTHHGEKIESLQSEYYSKGRFIVWTPNVLV